MVLKRVPFLQSRLTGDRDIHVSNMGKTKPSMLVNLKKQDNTGKTTSNMKFTYSSQRSKSHVK
jgi:hypothetical protein